MRDFDRRLQALPPTVLTGLRRGIEKESLRTTFAGELAATPHPAALGSALTHPHITTDFSEAQLELITGVHTDASPCLAELRDIHGFVYRHIGDEMMWCASMPCRLPREADIPIARYGTSNVARAKTVYRIGLSHRYGRRMQAISGIHYNFSVPPEVWPLSGIGGASEGYLALIRNFRRHAWLLLYLFGASPAVCSTFVEGRAHDLRELVPGTLYLPHATSLRMGPLGYLSEAQESLSVSYNDLGSYAASLQDALTRPYPAYEAIGIRDGGDYRQLAVTLLQIENEFYSAIRPKRIVRPGERPLHALRDRGIEYVEVRTLDLNPFLEVGIAPGTLRFLDVFLLHCLLSDSPPDTPPEIAAIARNNRRVAARGREPGLQLERGGQLVELREWAVQLLAESDPIAAALDAARGHGEHKAALSAAVLALDEPGALPSACVLAEMQERHGGSYLDFVQARSLHHRAAMLAEALPDETRTRFERAAAESLREQRAIEAADAVPFEEYRLRYLSPERLAVP